MIDYDPCHAQYWLRAVVALPAVCKSRVDQQCSVFSLDLQAAAAAAPSPASEPEGEH